MPPPAGAPTGRQDVGETAGRTGHRFCGWPLGLRNFLECSDYGRIIHGRLHENLDVWVGSFAQARAGHVGGPGSATRRRSLPPIFPPKIASSTDTSPRSRAVAEHPHPQETPGIPGPSVPANQPAFPPLLPSQMAVEVPTRRRDPPSTFAFL